MRLMNADKYCEFLNTYPLEKAQSNFMTFYRDALQHTFECEVKAIPIEWIEDWLDKTTGTRDGEDISQLPEQLKFAIEMINLMEMEWEKENEQVGSKN